MGHHEGMESAEGAPIRYLWLLRHGKAASAAPRGGSDRDRPLTGRGRRDAAALGARLSGGVLLPGVEELPAPQLVVSSSAVRTRQTADLVVRAMGGDVPVDSYAALYGADPDLVLRYVREIDEEVTGALVVGHNPTLYQLAWQLLPDRRDEGDAGGRTRREAHGFPTCALAVLGLAVPSWEDVADGSATLEGVFKPAY